MYDWGLRNDTCFCWPAATIWHGYMMIACTPSRDSSRLPRLPSLEQCSHTERACGSNALTLIQCLLCSLILNSGPSHVRNALCGQPRLPSASNMLTLNSCPRLQSERHSGVEEEEAVLWVATASM